MLWLVVLFLVAFRAVKILQLESTTKKTSVSNLSENREDNFAFLSFFSLTTKPGGQLGSGHFFVMAELGMTKQLNRENNFRSHSLLTQSFRAVHKDVRSLCNQTVLLVVRAILNTITPRRLRNAIATRLTENLIGRAFDTFTRAAQRRLAAQSFAAW